MDYEEVCKIKAKYPHVIFLSNSYRVGKDILLDFFPDVLSHKASTYLAHLGCKFRKTNQLNYSTELQKYIKHKFQCDLYNQTLGISYIGFDSTEDYVYFVMHLD